MKVSVLTVCYNSEETIRDTIESVLQQKNIIFEYIILDGGSQDRTIEIIKEYSDRIDHFETGPDSGVYDAFNKGLRFCSGDILSILNSDDVYQDDKVLSDIATAFRTPGVDIVIGDLDYVSRSDLNKIERVWRCGPYSHGAFGRGWHPPHPAFFVSKDIYNKYLKFDLSFKFAADFVAMYQLLEINKFKSVYLNRTCVKMRLGGLTSSNILNVLRGNIEIIRFLRTQTNTFRPLKHLYSRLGPKLGNKIKTTLISKNSKTQ